MKRFRIVVNGTPYEVEVEEVAGGTVPQTPAAPQPPASPAPQATAAPAPVKETPAPAPTKAPAAAGAGAVPAPMPGVILSIKVKPGQEVQRGEVLLTLEAMKMENEILAPRAGRVTQIFVQTGQSVNPQDPLVELE
jgi:glutaconyl-CoA decarboxylase